AGAFLALDIAGLACVVTLCFATNAVLFDAGQAVRTDQAGLSVIELAHSVAIARPVRAFAVRILIEEDICARPIRCYFLDGRACLTWAVARRIAASPIHAVPRNALHAGTARIAVLVLRCADHLTAEGGTHAVGVDQASPPQGTVRAGASAIDVGLVTVLD